jgi:predicted AAA+ superfamily ATPase
VLKKGHRVIELIQVCYEAINSDVEQREIRALLEAGGELKVKKLTVLTWDEKRETKKESNVIQFKPLWEWLLEKNQE